MMPMMKVLAQIMPRNARPMPIQLHNIHFVLTAIAIAALVPAVYCVQFPLRWDLADQFSAFCMLGFESVMVAATLYAIHSPSKTLLTVWDHYWMNKPRLIVTAVFAFVLIVAVGPKFASIALIDTMALLELMDRNNQSGKRVSRQIGALFPAAVYLFVGLVIVFTYTNIIVRVRFYGAYDEFFNNLDARMLGTTVSELAHHFAEILPEKLFVALDFIYYGMFVQIGAALVICGVSSGGRRALQFVGTILFAYYLSLLLFYWWPSHGPYYTCSGHFARLRHNLSAYNAQKNMLLIAHYLWEQKPVHVIPMGFYISFPCMHIAQPIVVLWFLKKWKRMVAVLLIYDVLLVASILLLEWHYFVDLLGGVVVAAAAVLIMGHIPESEDTPTCLNVIS